MISLSCMKLFLLTTTALAVLVFSGCLPKNDDLNSSDETINVEGISLENISLEQERNLQMPNNEYKSLEDFKEIAATQAVFETTKGTFVLDLYREQAPLTTANFLNLIDEGFYDGIVFHRVIPGFMAQFGDPKTKQPGLEAEWGTGGPDYRIMDEFIPELKHNDAGILSMANSGPNSGGSQVFITYEPQPHLDGRHAVFGKIVDGMDILESIEIGDKIIKASYR
jgi:cyclophilin family peptidyl-prolyl cis-trans isomerase